MPSRIRRTAFPGTTVSRSFSSCSQVIAHVQFPCRSRGFYYAHCTGGWFDTQTSLSKAAQKVSLSLHSSAAAVKSDVKLLSAVEFFSSLRTTCRDVSWLCDSQKLTWKPTADSTCQLLLKVQNRVVLFAHCLLIVAMREKKENSFAGNTEDA